MDTKSNREYLIELGERLKSARRLRGLTQKQAAAATGMSQSFLSAVENGKKTACTSQIVTLIHYYSVPYEMVFGSDSEILFNKDTAAVHESDIYIDLLNMLIGKADSSTLFNGTTNCLKLVVYVIFRTVYQENPKNSEKLFSVNYNEAVNVVSGLLEKAPDSISRYIRASRNINASKFELPLERNAELRSFIKECEQMINLALNNQKIITNK